METYTDKAAGLARNVKESGKYMIGQTVAVCLPQGDSIVHYASTQPTHTPTYCYLWWQIPDNMNRVNNCEIFWKRYPFEYGGESYWYHSEFDISTSLCVEITVDDGVTWQLIGTYTDGGSVSVMPYIRQLQDPAGALIGVRIYPEKTGYYCRVIAGGQMQGNLWSK